jgi:hypothetical protein
MIQIKEFSKEKVQRIFTYHLNCKAIINKKEFNISAIVKQNYDEIEFLWNCDTKGINKEHLDTLELDLLDTIYF